MPPILDLTASEVRIPQEQATRNREREVRIARLQGELATVEAQRETLRRRDSQREIERGLREARR